MSETIVAVASPFGPGAIALIRISGEEALPLAGLALGLNPESLEERRATRGTVSDSEGEVIDDVLVTMFRGPRSYTGEDVVEISTHGGVLVVQRVLGRLLECGARSAEPGEFTQRAFINGKMDLTQAEAVMDVISAQTDLALKAAQHQLEGRIGVETEALRAELLAVVAHLEAYIDFPDEDIDPDTGEQLTSRLRHVRSEVMRLLGTAEQGRILREGAKVVIFGEPNVGKSSLLNLLLGQERAIVSEIAGTTRDTVEEVLNLGGIPVRLIDTAGLRESADQVEKSGVERAISQVQGADLVLEVVDGSQPESGSRPRPEHKIDRRILVLNKSDLGQHPDWVEGPGTVSVSCREGSGLEELTAAVGEQFAFHGANWGQEAVAVNARHQDCLRRSEAAINAALEQLRKGLSPELAAVDLRIGLDAIGEVAGRVEAEELLGEIFGRFCIGK